MAANTLLLTLLSALVLFAIVAFVLRARRWRRGPAELRGMTPTRPSTTTSTRSSTDDLAETLQDPATWTVGFLLLVLVAVAGALAVVGAMPIPESAQGLVGTVLLIVAAIVLGGFVFAGVYSSVRGRGYGSAPATGLSVLIVGLIALVAVLVNLLLGIGG